MVYQSKILIVDDKPEIRNVLQDLLNERYACCQAGSGEEALELLNRQQFDLVITDIRMSGLSGLDLVPHVRRISPDTVVVMVSGESTIESAINAMRVGAFDYIMKPFDLRHVEAAVERAIEHHQSLRAAKRRHESYLEDLVQKRTAELNHVSLHDPITKLPNRVLFEDRLNQACPPPAAGAQLIAVMLMDLDHLKKINDSLGHSVGDELLRQVAERLSGNLREANTVARWGGDEFAFLVTNAEEASDVMEVAHGVQDALRAPFNLEDQTIFITSSVGVSLFPFDGANGVDLLRNADAALHRAKDLGENNYQFYTADINTRAIKKLEWESSLRRAIECQELIVYYQPLIEIKNRRIVGAEALIRWRHPELGLVSPAEFIPIAEETGLIVPIGEWVLRMACEQNQRWHQMGFDSLYVAVNLSARQFQQSNLSEVVFHTLQETDLRPSALELELTESAIMKNAESAARTLCEIKRLGVKVSVDDFGTGYSSLSYLKRFPIDTLKIDRSLLLDETTDPDDAALVMAIITLAHNLRLKVIAEGVETDEQLRFLYLLRCDEAQGYLFHRPVPAGEFTALLENNRREAALAAKTCEENVVVALSS
ncbi:MAG: EAL domain-containing protein [Pyrinomonadaceae bacterium]